MDDLITTIATLSDQPPEAIEPGTELIESGIVDSMNIAKLLAYIEDQTGRSIPLEDLDLDQIKTPAAIMETYLAPEAV